MSEDVYKKVSHVMKIAEQNKLSEEEQHRKLHVHKNILKHAYERKKLQLKTLNEDEE
jgi:hypothetical protein